MDFSLDEPGAVEFFLDFQHLLARFESLLQRSLRPFVHLLVELFSFLDTKLIRIVFAETVVLASDSQLGEDN